MKKKIQSLSEQMTFCSPLPSLIGAEGTAQIIEDSISKFEFKPLTDVENQTKENSFEEDTRDIETVDTEKNRPSKLLGALIQPQEDSPYGTIDERFEDLDIDVIEHFTEIPDFNRPCDCRYPLVVRTPSGYYCTDGWSFVEAAKAAGRLSIKCNVEYLENHSEVELALRKTGGRVKPRAGIASYGENVRNTNYTKRKLLESNQDLKVFCHGGARKGEAFTNNTEDNARKVLSLRLGRSPKTINQFLNHADFLNEETLNFLASENAPKEFFEEAQTTKRIELKTLNSRRASNDEITIQISQKIVDWYREYKATGKITPVWNERETDTETGSGERRISTGLSRNPRIAKSDGTQISATDDVIDSDIEPLEETMETEVNEEPIFDPWRGNAEEEQDDSFEKVKGDVEEVANRLLAAVTLDDPALFYEQIVEEVTSLHRISLRARVFGKEVLGLAH